MTQPNPHQQPADRTTAIRDLNDAFRRNPVSGVVMVTGGVDALPHEEKRLLLAAVEMFDAFNTGNDPYNEHDFGAIDQDGVTYFWKIDCFDPDYDMGSVDQADRFVTRRVLTVMRADEY
jgi:hypothetical protein